jgi:hypothetical protein
MTIERIHNIETNEIIEREMSDEEILKRQQLLEAALAEQAEAVAAKAALLAKLGITETEAKLLLS